jgi:hypothetical protein
MSRKLKPTLKLTYKNITLANKVKTVIIINVIELGYKYPNTTLVRPEISAVNIVIIAIRRNRPYLIAHWVYANTPNDNSIPIGIKK